MALLSDHGFFWVYAACGLLIAFLFIIAPFIVKNQKTSKRTALVAASMSLGLSLGSIALYQCYGALEGLKEKVIIQQIAQALSELQSTKTVSREVVLDRLMQLQHQLPQRSASWSYLAGVYQHLGFLEQAVSAYHQASILSPEVLVYAIQEALLVSRIKEGILPVPLKMQLEAFLEKEKNNQDILNLLAIHAYQQQEYAVALKYWQNLLFQAEKLSSEDKKTITLMVAAARAHSIQYGNA